MLKYRLLAIPGKKWWEFKYYIVSGDGLYTRLESIFTTRRMAVRKLRKLRTKGTKPEVKWWESPEVHID